jgi:type IV pilus assembly protein PilV
MRQLSTQANTQAGAAMIEGLIAMLIFSFGLLGTAAFQLMMIKQTSNVHYRLEASNLMSFALGDIEADSAQQACYTRTAGCANSLQADAWYARIATLPSAATYPASVTADADGVTTITIYWSLPKEKDRLGNPVVHKVEAKIASLKGS